MIQNQNFKKSYKNISIILIIFSVIGIYEIVEQLSQSSASMLRKEAYLFKRGKDDDDIFKYQTDDNTNEQYKKAMNYFDNQKYDESIKILKKIILLKPEDSQFLELLGDNYMQIQEYEDALFYFERSADISKQQGVCEKVGLTLIKLQQYEKAVEYLKINGGYYDSGFYLGLAYMKLGNYDDAIKQFKNTNYNNMKLQQKSQFHLGEIYFLKKQYDESRLFFIRFTNLYGQSDEDKYQAKFYIGQIYECQNKIPDAINTYQESLYYKQNFTSVLKIAQLYKQQKNFTSSILYFKKYIQNFTQDEQIINEIGLLYNKLNQSTDSIYWYKKTIEINPNNTCALAELGGIHYNLKFYDDSLYWINKCLEIDPDNVNGLIYLAEYNYYQLNNYNTTLTLLQKASKVQQYKDIILQIADIYENDLNSTDQAIFWYEEYDKIYQTSHYWNDDKNNKTNPEYWEAKIKIGDLYFEQKQYNKSIEWYNNQMQAYKGLAYKLSCNLGLSYNQLNQFNESVYWTKQCIKQNKDLVIKYNQTLDQELLSNYRDEIIFNQILKYQQEILYSLGMNYYNNSLTHQAVYMLNKITLLNSTYFLPYEQIAIIYEEQSMYDNAIKQYLKCYEIQPLNDFYILKVAKLYSSKGSDNQSINYYKKYIENNNYDESAYQSLTNLFLKKKMFDEGEKFYEAILESSPSNKLAKQHKERMEQYNKL